MVWNDLYLLQVCTVIYLYVRGYILTYQILNVQGA